MNANYAHHDTEAVLDITLCQQGAHAVLRHFPNVQTLYIRYQPDESDEEDQQMNRPYSVTTHSIEGMFSTLGDHQNIRHLVLDNLGDMEADANCQCQFPIRAITLFLRKSKNLASLQLDMDTAIAGTPQDGRDFLEEIRQNTTLKVLEIGDFGNESSIIGPEFSPLSVPKWEELTISHTGHQITREQVEQSIVRSKYLKKLLIDTSGGGFPGQHLARVLEGLQQNISQLTELNLLDDFTEERANACANMIRENTTLTHLFVSLGNESGHGAIITEALLQNANIHSLRFVLSSQPNGNATKMVHNLRHNESIRRVHFHFQGSFNQIRVTDKERFLKLFEDILEDNTSLEEIRMDKCHGAFTLTPKIQFYLSLNRAGRKELLKIRDQSEYRSLLVDKVIQNRANESIVFYFLSQNPSFLPMTIDAPVASVNPRKRKAGER